MNHDELISTLQDWNGVPVLAAVIGSGTRPIYKAIREKRLRAVSLNKRGDLRVHRDWFRDWLEGRAATFEPRVVTEKQKDGHRRAVVTRRANAAAAQVRS